MSNLPHEMLLDAEEFFKQDYTLFPKKPLPTSVKHISKMVLLGSLSEAIIEKRKKQGKILTQDDIFNIQEMVLESDYGSMGTSEILQKFSNERIDIPLTCKLGAKGVIRKIETERKSVLQSPEIDGLADSLEYDMKSSAIHLKIKDKPNAIRLYDCATAFGNELRGESKKRNTKSQSLPSVTKVSQSNTPEPQKPKRKLILK